MSEQWRDRLVEDVMSMVGKVWYVWGCQDISVTKTADCSGLVIEVLKKVGVIPVGFRDMSADGLSRYFSTTARKPKPGDLAFYGKNRICHVMFYIGEQVIGGCRYRNLVSGMCGGRKNMSLKQAKMFGAALWTRPHPRYRNDFRFFRRVA